MHTFGKFWSQSGCSTITMAITESHVTESQVKVTGYVMMALARVVFAGWFGMRFWGFGSRVVQLEDLFVVSSWLSSLATTIFYPIIMPGLYTLATFLSGASPFAEFVDDVLFIKKIFFGTTFLLRVSLWSVKLSAHFVPTSAAASGNWN